MSGADGPREAFALSRAGRVEEARALMERTAAEGHGQAGVFAAIWRLIGFAGPVDVMAAEHFLRGAAEHGEAVGLTMLAALVVTDLRAARDWEAAAGYLIDASLAGERRAQTQLALLLPEDDPQRLPLLEAAGRGGDPAALRQLNALGSADASAMEVIDADLARVDWMALRKRLRWPHERALPTPELQREDPWIVVHRGLLSGAECGHLSARGAPHLKRALVGGPGGQPMLDPVRSNDAMVFGPIETDAVVQSLDARIALALALPAAHGEPLGLLRYRPGQAYAPHCDWIDPSAPGKADEVARGGQRVATLLVYLNEEYSAGETRFVHLDWSFTGRTGDALAWRNVDAGGKIDPRTLHAGMSPTSGEKWLLSKWMRDLPQVSSPEPGPA